MLLRIPADLLDQSPNQHHTQIREHALALRQSTHSPNECGLKNGQLIVQLYEQPSVHSRLLPPSCYAPSIGKTPEAGPSNSAKEYLRLDESSENLGQQQMRYRETDIKFGYCYAGPSIRK